MTTPDSRVPKGTPHSRPAALKPAGESPARPTSPEARPTSHSHPIHAPPAAASAPSGGSPVPAAMPDAASRVPLAWMLVCGLGGFCVCLLLVVGVMGWWMLRGKGPNETAPKGGATASGTQIVQPAAQGVGPNANVANGKPLDGGAVPGQLPGISAVEPMPVPPPMGDAKALQPEALLLEIAADVAKKAEGAGAPPDIRPGKVSVLGTQGTLDSLNAPMNLPKGLLPFLQGLDLLHSLQPAKAIAKFDEAIQADAENSRFYTARGAAQVLTEKMDQSLPDLQRAMKLDPKNVLASRLTRLAYLMMGDQLKASKFHGHGGHAEIDFLITEVGVPYGNRIIAARAGLKPEIHDQMKAAASLQKLPTLMRLVATSFRTSDEQSSQALFALGVAQFNASDFPAARRSFEAVLVKYPYDWTSRYYYARCVLETGDPEAARNELTYLLCWARFLPEAFVARALCAARQNDLKRAEKDLATAKRLDPLKAAEAENAVAQARANPAAAGEAADVAAWDKLLEDAKRNVKFDDLVASALSLRQSVDARRRRWDEIYQDRLFELMSAARANPGNADRTADVAEFLRENHRVRGLQVAPNGSQHFFRRQTPETSRDEIELAYALAEEGLQNNPKHPRSWAIKSAILLHTYGRLTEAEKSAEYAIQFDPKLIAGHMALSDCYKEYSTRLRERAAALRAPKPQTRSVRIVDSKGNYVRTDSETYYVPASPAELAAAAECDRQAAIYEQKEQVCLNNALAAAKGTKQEPFYQALMLYLRKDYQGARGWLEKAVAQNPEDPAMRHRLANCLEMLDLKDEATEELARAINLQQTTGEVWLAVAWTKLERTSWDDAAEAVKRARSLDPSDARAAAFQSILEESGRKDATGSLGAAVAALAQEEARARSNQSTFLPTQGTGQILSPEDAGLTIMLRLRVARMVFQSKPEIAAECYLGNVALEPRLSEWNLAKSVESAMLPFPDRDAKQIPAPPPLVAILKNNRIFAGQVLLNAKRVAAAGVHFAAAENFANLLPAGGTAYLEFELEPPYVPFRVSSMPMYVKVVNGAALIQQKRLAEARVELQQVRYYLANRSQEQREMKDDPIPAMYERLAPAVGLR
ncbi:MAG: tetratricopeptide repeat protein [Planctomycetaceae bacterium]|nr:tetratricopeptide repeat protein [Planctomycetaceae bacterium]